MIFRFLAPERTAEMHPRPGLFYTHFYKPKPYPTPQVGLCFDRYFVIDEQNLSYYGDRNA